MRGVLLFADMRVHMLRGSVMDMGAAVQYARWCCYRLWTWVRGAHAYVVYGHGACSACVCFIAYGHKRRCITRGVFHRLWTWVLQYMQVCVIAMDMVRSTRKVLSLMDTGAQYISKVLPLMTWVQVCTCMCYRLWTWVKRALARRCYRQTRARAHGRGVLSLWTWVRVHMHVCYRLWTWVLQAHACVLSLMDMGAVQYAQCVVIAYRHGVCAHAGVMT